MLSRHGQSFDQCARVGLRGITSRAWGLACGVACAFAALVLGFPGLGLATGPRLFGVVDLHADLPYQVVYKSKPAETGAGQYVATWLASSGVTDVVMPLYIPRDVSSVGPRMQDLEASYRHMSQLLPATKPYLQRPCSGAPGVNAHFSLEGAEPLGFELRSVELWASRLKLIGLVHSYDTAVASSSGSGSGPRGYGLTRRGKELVRRIHAYGAIADVSHASDEAFADVYRQALAAGKPMVASHSNSRALADHPRNLSDTQLRAVAQTGGVVGINFHSRFLIAANGRAQLADVVRHIQHVIAVAGINHVAIGSDFEGGILPPAELEDVRGFPRLGQALLAAGLSREQVSKVFGQNARRILCER